MLDLRKRDLLGSLLLGSCLAPLCATPALAQADDDDGILNRIIVTAQKREQNLQEVPLAVTALDQNAIDALRIEDIRDISSLAPNLTVTQIPASTSAAVFFIRGIGDGDPILTSEASVGLYMDGVILPRTANAILELLDLERVEVLRGPQGTLYGRNTAGGAINLIAKRPSEEMGVSASISYGRFDYQQGKATLETGNIGDTGIAIKFSYLHEQQDGYVDNTLANDANDPGAYNNDAFRLAARWELSESATLDYTTDFNHRRGRPPLQQLTIVGPAVAGLTSISPLFGGNSLAVSPERAETVLQDREDDSVDRTWGHNVTLSVDLGDVTLKSITGYREWENSELGTDIDANSGVLAEHLEFITIPIFPQPIPTIAVRELDIFSATNERDQDQFSQEIQLSGTTDRITWQVGAYYFREEGSESNLQNFSLILPEFLLERQLMAQNPSFPQFTLSMLPNPNSPTGFGSTTGVLALSTSALLDYQTRSRSFAGFGQVTYAVNDRWNLTGGIRYTDDSRRLMQVSPTPRDETVSFDRINWSVSTDYQVNDDINTYFRVATGYKSGGINPRSANSGFAPEDLLSFEGGIKSELMDKRVRLNLSAFFSDYDDLQVQRILAGSGGAVTVTENAASAEYKGIEVELQALLADGLTLQSSFGYTDRKFKGYDIVAIVPNPAFDPTVPINPALPPELQDPRTFPAFEQAQDVSDTARFIFSADTTFTVGLTYEVPLVDQADVIANVTYTYRSGLDFSPLGEFADTIAEDGLGLLNASVRIANIADTGVSVSMWGRNITGETYRASAIDFGGLGFATNAYGVPATYGVDLSVSF